MQAPKMIWDNILDTATATLYYTTSITGYGAENTLDWRTHTLWRPAGAGTGSTSAYMTIDLGAGGDRAADCIAVAAHNLHSGEYKTSVWASTNATTWAQLLNGSSGVAAASNNVLMSTFTQTTARYWRITFHATNAAEVLTVGVVALGTATEFPRPIAIGNSPINMGVEMKSNRSQTGILLGNVVKYHPLSLNMDFGFVSATYFVDSSGDPSNFGKFWYDHGRYARPFFIQVSGDAFPRANYFMRLTDRYSYTMPMYSTGIVQSLSLDMISCEESA